MTKENNTNVIAPSLLERAGGEVITSETVTMPAEGQSTDTSSWGNKVRMGTLALMTALTPSASTVTVGGAGVATMATMASCDTDEPVEPVETKLTAEEQAFAKIFDATNPKAKEKGMVVPSIIDGTPVIQITIDIVPNNKAFEKAFEKFMDIELRLIDAKAGTYSITPIINKSSVAAVLEVAKQLEPGKSDYVISLINEALNASGVKRDLTGGEFIMDKDDNNPATTVPFMAQLPERFTMDEFGKYSQNSNKTKSFTISKDETYNLKLAAATVGVTFERIIQAYDPAKLANARVAN